MTTSPVIVLMGSLEEGVEAGGPELGGDDGAVTLENADELSLRDPGNAGSPARLEDQVGAGMRKGLSAVGRQSIEVPLHGPEVLHQMGQVGRWVIAGVGDPRPLGVGGLQHSPGRVSLGAGHRRVAFSQDGRAADGYDGLVADGCPGNSSEEFMKVLTAGLALTLVLQVTPLLAQKEAAKMQATGTFTVKVVPLPADDSVDTGGFGRLSLDKEFSGALAGTSKGQMVGAFTAVEGSAGYVALERVTGTLNGKKGSFILQHSGSMKGGASTIIVTVVPDSGTEELVGLAGTMEIIIEGKKHSYVFDYTL